MVREKKRRYVYRVMIGKPDGNRQLRRPRRRSEDNNKTGFMLFCTVYCDTNM